MSTCNLKQHNVEDNNITLALCFKKSMSYFKNLDKYVILNINVMIPVYKKKNSDKIGKKGYGCK